MYLLAGVIFFTLPASPHCELHGDVRGVDGPVVGHQVRLVRRPVHVQRHHRELHIDHIVVPLLVTDLGDTASIS